jgi:hypothetical protein
MLLVIDEEINKAMEDNRLFNVSVLESMLVVGAASSAGGAGGDGAGEDGVPPRRGRGRPRKVQAAADPLV